ncbi:bifunctional 2-polyprenyl-6-hydroxyphenol methylase/3-demethylubiquinol 3-O-methyltransferase UbiG [Streptomyces sp. NA04227]|uniref:class I SAM-dependent methyltransferase n=1 Tax=Streptomyces sp. NA04227 TaxID=2742136 RepID=UPI0020CA290D|nr:class I SAM-dependent methyltransferase [Streptomyces sp. NA04227]
MNRVYDDERLAGAYERGNEMPVESLRSWVDLIASRLDRTSPALLEVGTGTGMFAAGLARWIEGADLLAVDPSEPMLAEARRHNPHPSVRYEPGSAEAVPAPADSFDGVFLSRVIHHVTDRKAAARELARVLRADGKLIIRTTFREHLDALVYDYWPQLRVTDQRRFPGEKELVNDFVTAGFVLQEVASFAQPVTASLREYHDRLVTRPQSKFTHLTTRQFQDGLRRLEAAVERESEGEPMPVTERYDVAVFSLA